MAAIAWIFDMVGLLYTGFNQQILADAHLQQDKDTLKIILCQWKHLGGSPCSSVALCVMNFRDICPGIFGTNTHSQALVYRLSYGQP